MEAGCRAGNQPRLKCNVLSEVYLRDWKEFGLIEGWDGIQ